MNRTLPIEQMSVPERLDLITELWESISESTDALEIPDWHRAELERRLANADAKPADSVLWEELKARLSQRT